VTLRPERAKSALQGHPWIYSGAIGGVAGDPEAALAKVETADGRSLGAAFWSSRSQIRARLLFAPRGDAAFFAELP